MQITSSTSDESDNWPKSIGVKLGVQFEWFEYHGSYILSFIYGLKTRQTHAYGPKCKRFGMMKMNFIWV